MKGLATLAGVVALMLPAPAAAVPVAQLDGPVDNECVGTFYPTRGKASWTGAGTKTFTVRRADTGQVLQTGTDDRSSPPFSMPGIDTALLPVGVTITMDLSVFEQQSGTTATASRSFFPQLDRQLPTKPDVTVRVVSSRAVWVEFSNSADLGCSGGIKGYTGVATTDSNGGLGIFTQGQVDVNGIRNGMVHEAISTKSLSGSSHYRLNVFATDKVGNSSGFGRSDYITTPNDYSTVVAGQVRGSNGQLLTGVNVSAAATSCCYPPASYMTNGSGWYQLPLSGVGNPWAIQYGPTCSFSSLCDQGWGTSTDSYTNPVDVAGIEPRNKVLQPGG